MRSAVFALCILATSAPALAQQTSFAGYGPYRFGMRMSEFPEWFAASLNPIRIYGGPEVVIGDVPFGVTLTFDMDGLARIELQSAPPVASLDECSNKAVPPLRALTRQFGVFNDWSSDREQTYRLVEIDGAPALRIVAITMPNSGKSLIGRTNWRASNNGGSILLNTHAIESSTGALCTVRIDMVRGDDPGARR